MQSKVITSFALFLSNLPFSLSNGGDIFTTQHSCSERYCGTDVAKTYGPFDSTCDSTGLSLNTLASYTHNGDTLIELLGPLDPTRAAAVVLLSAHGGDLTPNYISDRSENDQNYCPSSGCKTYQDTYTVEIALNISQKIIENYCSVPYVIINRLHRRKVDPNRDVLEGAQEDPIAVGAWEKFHDFTSAAQNWVQGQFGTVKGTTGLVGVKGLLLDVHGYSGFDWDPAEGSPLIQWGYRLFSSSLEDCPLDSRSWSTVESITHARYLPGQSLECLVRGPKSIGTRLADQMPLASLSNGYCGKAIPSFEYPSPDALANDPSWCKAYPNGTCSFSGGSFDLEVHEHLDWKNKTGNLMNGVQVELPRCIRFAEGNRDLVHAEIGNAFSLALCSFLEDLFPGVGTCAPPSAAAPTNAPTISPVSPRTTSTSLSPINLSSSAPSASPTIPPIIPPTSSAPPSPFSFTSAAPSALLTIPPKLPLTSSDTSKGASNLSCTESECGFDEAFTHGPFLDCDSSGLAMSQLAAYNYTDGTNTDILVEIMGPSDKANAAGVLIVVAYGGSLKPSYISDRNREDPSYCPPNGCSTDKSSYTIEIAMEMADQLIKNYCRVPYIVINRLHRSKLDANREVREATHGDPIAEKAWETFHKYIADAQLLMRAQLGTATGTTSLAGIRGILVDLQGYSGYDWDSSDGAPLIHWGYGMDAETSLDPDQYCPLDTRFSGNVGTFSHAGKLGGQTLECLVRGPKSLGARVNAQLPLPSSPNGFCGTSLPSYEYPSPLELENDSAWCESISADSEESCQYFVGSYNAKHHNHLDWENLQGTLMNTVTMNLPRCLRFAGDRESRSQIHSEIAAVLSISLCSFLEELFPGANTCTPPSFNECLGENLPCTSYLECQSVCCSERPKFSFEGGGWRCR